MTITSKVGMRVHVVLPAHVTDKTLLRFNCKLAVVVSEEVGTGNCVLDSAIIPEIKDHVFQVSWLEVVEHCTVCGNTVVPGKEDLQLCLDCLMRSLAGREIAADGLLDTLERIQDLGDKCIDVKTEVDTLLNDRTSTSAVLMASITELLQVLTWQLYASDLVKAHVLQYACSTVAQYWETVCRLQGGHGVSGERARELKRLCQLKENGNARE